MRALPNYQEWVERAKKGDAQAYSEIYRIFLDRIYRFVYSLVLDEPLAEDITQDTFVKVWKYLPKFSSERGTFQAFLYKVARNLVIDYQRKKKNITLTQQSEFYIQSDVDLEEDYIKTESSALLDKALKTLSDFDRQLVVLRYFEELSYKEIESIVGKKESAIRVRVHRALKIMEQKTKNET